MVENKRILNPFRCRIVILLREESWNEASRSFAGVRLGEHRQRPFSAALQDQRVKSIDEGHLRYIEKSHVKEEETLASKVTDNPKYCYKQHHTPHCCHSGTLSNSISFEPPSVDHLPVSVAFYARFE